MESVEGKFVSCHAIQLKSDKKLLIKSGKAEITLSRNVKGRRIIKKENMISLPMVNPLVVGPQETKMAVLPYQVKGDGV